jgi:hypothetical protein
MEADARGGTAPATEAVRLAALTFAVDFVTADVWTSLEAGGIRSVLLKGPAIAAWLFPGEGRFYADTDLLVRAADRARAEAVLTGLGFVEDASVRDHARIGADKSTPWERPADGAVVDLHHSIFGLAEASDDEVFAVFSAGEHRLAVGGAQVRVPSRPARLLHIALHAIQHGGAAAAKPMLDLERAVAVAPEALWREAAELAARLGAAAEFGSGLRLVPAGERLATAIGVATEGSATATLRIARVPMAEGFAELAATNGARAKLALLRREAFPDVAFMRWWTPLARRGRRGLPLAYVWRALWLLRRAPTAWLAWRRATRGRPSRR